MHALDSVFACLPHYVDVGSPVRGAWDFHCWISQDGRRLGHIVDLSEAHLSLYKVCHGACQNLKHIQSILLMDRMELIGKQGI